MDIWLTISSLGVMALLLVVSFKFPLSGLIGAFFSTILGILTQTSGITETFCGSIGTSLTCTNAAIPESTSIGLSFAALALTFYTLTIVRLAKESEALR